MEYKLVKLFFIIPLILILTSSAYAQKTVSSTYVVSTAKSTYGGDLGLSYTTVIGANSDNVSSGPLTLPFTFNYLGQTYTHIRS